MATAERRLAEDSRRQKGLRLSEEARERIRLNAALQDVGQSELVESLILRHLPEVKLAPQTAQAS